MAIKKECNLQLIFDPKNEDDLNMETTVEMEMTSKMKTT